MPLDWIPALGHGAVLALGLILPLGPQNAFVLSQGATHARLARAAPVVLAASLADTALILGAVLGVSALVLAAPVVRVVLVVVGVLFLVAMGWNTWRTPPPSNAAETATAWPARRQAVFALSVSLLNPHAILDTVGVIGPSSLAYADGARVAFTVACIAVSWAWFVALAITGRALGHVPAARRVLNRASAIVMWASAAMLAASLG